MLAYISKRFIAALFTIFLAAVLVFCALLIIPGDPVEIILGMNANPAAATALREQLGLDAPPMQRFWQWFTGLFRGDFGTSIKWDTPVRGLIAQRLVISIPLAFGGMLVACLIALPLGIFAALNRNTWIDPVISALSQLGAAIPSFWLGILFILLFAVELNWLPSLWLKSKPIQSMILPILTLGLGQAAIMTRMTRTAMLEVLNQDYVRTARSKGLAPRRVISVHALRNAMITIITIIGLSLSELLIGSIIIEQVFSLPGMGSLVLTAIRARDFPLLQSEILIYASIIVFFSFVVDILYSFLDPRIRYH